MGLSAGILMASQAVGGAYSQAQAASAQGDYQKTMSDINARFDEEKAKEVRAKGEQDASRARAAGNKAGAYQRASMAAAGLDATTGSAADVVAQSYENGELDAIAIRTNAYREALGYQQRAEQSRSQGRIAKQAGQFEAQQSLISGGLRAGAFAMDAFDSPRGTKDKGKRGADVRMSDGRSFGTRGT